MNWPQLHLRSMKVWNQKSHHKNFLPVFLLLLLPHPHNKIYFSINKLLWYEEALVYFRITNFQRYLDYWCTDFSNYSTFLTQNEPLYGWLVVIISSKYFHRVTCIWVSRLQYEECRDKVHWHKGAVSLGYVKVLSAIYIFLTYETRHLM